MSEEIGKSRRRTTGIVCATAAAVLSVGLLAPALSPAKPPAVDEYTLDFPHPGNGSDNGGNHGDGHGGGAAGSSSTALAPAVRAQLSDPADRPLLAIATDPELGAISSTVGEPGRGAAGNGKGGYLPTHAGGERGVLAAATGALGDGALPLLGLGMLSVVALAVFAARRRGASG